MLVGGFLGFASGFYNGVTVGGIRTLIAGNIEYVTDVV